MKLPNLGPPKIDACKANHEEPAFTLTANGNRHCTHCKKRALYGFPNELHIAEQLIKAEYAKNFGTLTQKNPGFAFDTTLLKKHGINEQPTAKEMLNTLP